MRKNIKYFIHTFIVWMCGGWRVSVNYKNITRSVTIHGGSVSRKKTIFNANSHWYERGDGQTITTDE